MRIYTALLLASVALAACGGDSDDAERVLRLGSGNVTEAEFRSDTRAALLTDASFCPSLRGLDDAEIADAVVRAQDMTPTHEPEQKSRERAAAILREECERVSD